MVDKSHYNMQVPVSEETLDELRSLGMAASIQKAMSGQATPEFVEAVRRFYPAIVSELDAKLGQAPAAQDSLGQGINSAQEVILPPENAPLEQGPPHMGAPPNLSSPPMQGPPGPPVGGAVGGEMGMGKAMGGSMGGGGLEMSGLISPDAMARKMGGAPPTTGDKANTAERGLAGLQGGLPFPFSMIGEAAGKGMIGLGKGVANNLQPGDREFAGQAMGNPNVAIKRLIAKMMGME